LSGSLSSSLRENGISGGALHLSLALNFSAYLLGPRQNVGILLLQVDPVFKRKSDFLGDATLRELGHNVQLRAQIIVDADSKCPNRASVSLTRCVCQFTLLSVDAAGEFEWIPLSSRTALRRVVKRKNHYESSCEKVKKGTLRNWQHSPLTPEQKTNRKWIWHSSSVEILDPMVHELRDELRQLRRQMTPFQQVDLADCPTLTMALGSGSSEQAFTALFALREKFGSSDDSDVNAFFETSGHLAIGETLEARLVSYSSAHSVDPRTGLRRSDRGADRLARLIRDGIPFERPWGNVIVVQSGPEVEGLIRLNVERGASTSVPRVWIGGEELLGLKFELRTAGFSNQMLSATEPIPKTAIHADPESDETLLDLRIVWNMPVWPQWYVGAQLADSRLLAVLSTNRNFETTVSLSWAYARGDLRRGTHELASLDAATQAPASSGEH
jgi:hypothetical protein